MNPRGERPLIALSLLLAFVLTLLPLPATFDLMRPYWVALVVMYWHLETARLRYPGQSFVLGLVLDLLTGTLLGRHALSLVILNFLLDRFRARIRFFPAWQRGFTLIALLLNDRIVHFWIIALQGNAWPPWQWWLAPLVTIVFWPPFFLVLDAMRRRQRLARP